MIAYKKPKSCPIKLWVDKLEDVEPDAIKQLEELARLPFVGPHIAVMPDVHVGKGACIGSVIPTKDAIIPSAVGVDIGCGMLAIETNRFVEEFILNATEKEYDLNKVRTTIERFVPVGRTNNGHYAKDTGSWQSRIPNSVKEIWEQHLYQGFERIKAWTYPDLDKTNNINHLGTLGTGNHFIELSSDETGTMWVIVHSGSRGVGNKLGALSIQTAKKLMDKYHIQLDNPDLAYFPRDTREFDDYMDIVQWCQDFAKFNRILIVENVLKTLADIDEVDEINRISCHHNYVRIENHNGKNLYLTRKGAIRAGGKEVNGIWNGDYGVIPGSMGTQSFIVRGKGNSDSFNSASHGAGRKMSRTAAKNTFKQIDIEEQTAGVECKKDNSIVDEIPGSYKDINEVMRLQQDLVYVEHTLTPFLCIKG